MSSIGILPESLQTALEQLLERVNACDGGIQIILLSTSEGVPLGRIPAQSGVELTETTLSSLESTWAPAPKQLLLLKMSKLKKVTAYYETATVLHLYYSPVVVTLVLSGTAENSNMGVVESTAIPLLEKTLQPLCTTLLNSLSSPNTNDGTIAAATMASEWWSGQEGFYQ